MTPNKFMSASVKKYIWLFLPYICTLRINMVLKLKLNLQILLFKNKIKMEKHITAFILNNKIITKLMIELHFKIKNKNHKSHNYNNN